VTDFNSTAFVPSSEVGNEPFLGRGPVADNIPKFSNILSDNSGHLEESDDPSASAFVQVHTSKWHLGENFSELEFLPTLQNPLSMNCMY
jgi:hypothetical protein